jgi:hypothetical protein
LSEQKHISKPEEVKKTNSGNALKEVSTSSQEATYGVAPGEMAFSSLQSTVDRSSRSNGITQLQEKANQSKGIFQLQAKADSRSTRVTEPIQTKASDPITTQLKGERTIQEDQGLEQEGSVVGTKTVQLVKVESPPVVPNKPSGSADVAQLEKDKESSFKGGIVDTLKGYFGFGKPKEKTKKNDGQAGATKDNEGQAEAPKKVEVQAVETKEELSNGEPKTDESILPQLQEEIKSIQEKIIGFKSLLNNHFSRQFKLEEFKKNEVNGKWELFVKQKKEITALQENFVVEQKKIPPGRKKVLIKSGEGEFPRLLQKDYSKLWEKEYQAIEDSHKTLTAVKTSAYWFYPEKISNNFEFFDSEQKQYNEFLAKPNTTNFARTSHAKKAKTTFEDRLARLEINKGLMQPLEVQVVSLLAELDAKSKNIKVAPPLSLENLKSDFQKLQKFVEKDYDNWKDEKRKIDALLVKKNKRWGGLTEEEKEQLEIYKNNNSYLSDEPSQENSRELEEILKSLSKPTANSENLSEESEEEKDRSTKTNSLSKENDRDKSKSDVDISDKLYSKEDIEKAKSNMFFGERLFRKSREEVHNDRILNDKNLKSEYQRVGYVEKEDLKLGKRFIEKTPEMLKTLDWNGISKDKEQFAKLLGEDDNSKLEKAASKVNEVQGKSTLQAGIAQGGSKIKQGTKNSEVKNSTDDHQFSPVAEAVNSELTDKGVDIKEVKSVFSDALVGVLTSIDGILKLKDMYSDNAEADGKNIAKAAGGIAKLAMAGLKITSTINDYSVTSTVMGAIPVLGVAIETIKVAELYFTNSIAETSENTMEMYAEKSHPPNFDNEKVFERKEKNVLGSSKIIKQINPNFYKAAKEALKEYSNSRGDVSLSNRAISALNEKFNLEKPIGLGVKEDGLDFEEYIAELETYSLMAKLEEINFTKRIHSRYNLVLEGVKLSGQIIKLIPGGQIAAGALEIAAGTMGVVKSGAVMVNKYMTGDDIGIFGTGEYGKEKHAKYVMHAKKIIEMYSTNAADLIIQQEDVEQAPAIDKKIEQNLTVLEKVVYAAGAYPPDLYKSAEGNKKGYKAVGKLVNGMKQR